MLPLTVAKDNSLNRNSIGQSCTDACRRNWAVLLTRMNLNDWRVQLDMKELLNCILIREGILEIYW